MKKKISTAISMICICAILCSFSTVFAASADIKAATRPSNVIVEREDVPLSVALTDPSFSVSTCFRSATYEDGMQPLAVDWDVWGEREENEDTGLDRPVGYSEHKNGSTVLETYHYTRTFLGNSSSPRGDSGRIWGNYTVRAQGTDCIDEVWDSYVHRVFYGTED